MIKSVPTGGIFGRGRILRQAPVKGFFWRLREDCFTIYRGQDGDIDYSRIMAAPELTETQFVIPDQFLPASTIWHYVRRQVSHCGLESPDGVPVCVVAIDENGDAIALSPNAPVMLTATAQANGTVKLQWDYPEYGQAIAPTGFRIYIDNGFGFDFSSQDDEITSPFIRTWTSDPLSDGQTYRFCVRSYNSTTGGESQNSNFAAIVADATGPDACAGLTASWEEI